MTRASRSGIRGRDPACDGDWDLGTGGCRLAGIGEARRMGLFGRAVSVAVWVIWVEG